MLFLYPERFDTELARLGSNYCDEPKMVYDYLGAGLSNNLKYTRKAELKSSAR